MKNKKAAMEMSMGTIVTIVLLMAALILGLTLTKSIFSGVTGAAETSVDQLNEETKKLFGDSDKKVILTPTGGKLKIRTGKADAIGISIRNIGTSLDQGTDFSYEVLPVENSCGLSEEQALSLISTGQSYELEIPLSGVESWKVNFRIPETGVPDCDLDYKVQTRKGTEPYKQEQISIEIKA